MTSRIIPAALTLVGLVLSVLLGASSALAQPVRAQGLPRTVVLRFEGPRAEQARRAAVDGLAGSYELIEEDALVEAADRIGVDVSTPEGMASVVEHLGVTLVIGGFVEGSGRRATTTVWVMDVRGNELTRRQVGPPTGRGAAAAIGEAASMAASEAMATLHPPEPVPVEVVEAPSDPVDREEIPGREPEQADVSGRWNQPLVRALVGLRIRNRSIAVSPDTINDRFDADFFPDLQLLVEARPFAMDPGALRGLYFALSGGVSVGMSYVQVDGDAPGMTSFNFEVDAGYGLVLAETVELVLSVGVGLDGFDLADTTLADFPSALYSFVRPAVQGRIRLLDQLLVAELGLGGRIVWDAGQLQAQDRFGPEGTSAGGVDFHVGLAGTVDPGFTWAARFAYTGYFLGFNGGIEESRATDEAIQFWLMVGWAF